MPEFARGSGERGPHHCFLLATEAKASLTPPLGTTALHGTWFLQTVEVSAVLPRLACQWHRASKALGSCNLASYPPFWSPSQEGWSESWAVCQSLTLLLFMPGAGRREPVVCWGMEGGSVWRRLPLPGTLPPVIPGRLLLGFYIVQRKVIFSEPQRF